MRAGILALALALAGACDETEPRSAEPEAAEAAEPAAPAPPEPPPEPPEPADLDEMTEGELEAACFEGQQRACDRLGH
ncbi:MAG: hypothetical protein ACODAU_12350 [Myxococcota bacterium]